MRTQEVARKMPVHIERSTESRTCILRLEGELDLGVVPEVRECLDGVLDGGCENVVLDFAEVVYADSSALGLLVWLDHRLAPSGGKVVLAGANRDVSRVLELSGLVGVAPCIATSSSVSIALEGLTLAPAPAELKWTESFSVPARVESLARTRNQVCEMLAPLGMAEASLFDLKVAIGEALANAVRHGSPGGERDDVEIEVSVYDDRVVITVKDRGDGFAGEPSCGDDVYASSGRGVMFMRALMDQVGFGAAAGGGTVVTLVKHLPAGDASRGPS